MSCGIVFELSPNGTGGWTETILYTFQGGADGDTPSAGVILDASGHVYGTAQALGLCCGVVFEVFREAFAAFSPTNLNFGDQTLNIPSTSLVTFTNSGNLPLDVTSIGITGANSLDFAESHDCPLSLSPHLSCAINVTFTPSAYGTRSGAISITDNASGSPQSVSISGSGVLPAVMFSSTTFNFGDQTVGTTSSAQVATLTNTGLGTLIIKSLGIAGANGSEFTQLNSCPSTLSSGNSCSISVTFAPNVLGDANASIIVVDNSQDSRQTLPLTGTGVTGIGVSPASISFPNQYVGTSGLPQIVTVTNTGNTVLIVNTVSSSGTDFVALSSCASPIQAGSNCSIGVFFDPTASGTRNGVLTITASAFGSPRQNVALTGVGEDFVVASSSSSSATVAAGQAANYTLVITPAGGFNGSVTLSCNGAPALSTCSLSPGSTVLKGYGSVPVTVTVTTAARSASLTGPLNLPAVPGRLALGLAMPGLAGVLIGTLGSGRRKGRRWLLYGLGFLCVLSMMIWFGCGSGSSNSSNSDTGTPPGTYNLTVKGTYNIGAATLAHTTKLTLIVR